MRSIGWAGLIPKVRPLFCRVPERVLARSPEDSLLVHQSRFAVRLPFDVTTKVFLAPWVTRISLAGFSLIFKVAPACANADRADLPTQSLYGCKNWNSQNPARTTMMRRSEDNQMVATEYQPSLPSQGTFGHPA